MSIITSTFQLMGTFMYVGTEVYDGFKNVPLVRYIILCEQSSEWLGWGMQEIKCVVYN